MAGVIHIPWYATGLRGDKLELALADISRISLRYGARSHGVYRFRDDRYKFLQVVEFEDKKDFDRYWHGQEFIDFRVLCSGWYQVPVVYGWSDLIAAGAIESPEPIPAEELGDHLPASAEPAEVGDLAG